ncbi:hypothetical protein K3495_g15752, partial [Podosphaera aphanis]
HHKGNLELPAKPPNVTESSWATVARNGHKKVRTSVPKLTPSKDMNPKPQACPPARPQPSKSGQESKSDQNDSDKRLFVRLPLEHEWRKLSPAAIRELIVKRLSVLPSCIGRIKPVRSGFALSPSNSDARECLLKAANGLFLSGAKLEPAANWTPLLVPTVPKFIVTLKGRIEITKSMLADEIERVTSIRPDALKPFGHNHPHAPHKTWMAYFSKAPRPGFRVFDQSGLISKFKQKHPIDFCKRCNGYHSSRFCSRAPSCGNCGSTMHEEEACKALTKCRNCGGPHRSDSKKCLARPNRLGAPTKEQLLVYCRAGEREYNAAARAKAAEDRAARAESIAATRQGSEEVNIVPEVVEEEVEMIIDSQLTPTNPEIIGTSEEIQQSLEENDCERL